MTLTHLVLFAFWTGAGGGAAAVTGDRLGAVIGRDAVSAVVGSDDIAAVVGKDTLTAVVTD